MKQLAGALFVAGWFLAPSSASADSSESWGAQAKAILHAHCAGCHGGGKASKGGFGFVLDRDQLIARRLVLPGKSSQSDLFTRIEQGEMPPPSSKTQPSRAELAVLKRWIDAGAPSFDRPSQAKAMTESEVAGAILGDLNQLDPRRRRFTRYFTLTHLVRAQRPEHHVETTREAAAKLLNSLSWHPRLTLPEPLAGGSILRIDLRAYKWNAASWEKLVSAYPYRLPGESAEIRAIANHTGTDCAALRADWFVATASRPPLYHDLLQLSTTDRALERFLQVDVPGNLQDDNVLRSGFNDSGVSKNNRLLERHDAAFGALWRSYDFERNTGRQNLFDHPLGPNTGATSFQAAGGEIIFHLPNSLHGYLLIDASGRRIDKAPGEIVADPRRPDQRVETGISCMSCHARGLLFKADQLRAHVEKNAAVFDKATVAAIRAIHPRKAQFQAQIEEDNVRYLKALSAFGLRDPDQEPINLVTQRFEATLDGRTAAAELDMSVEEFGRFLKQDSGLSRLFGGLLTPGGTGQRSVFQENFSAMARRYVATGVSPVAGATTLSPFHGHTATVNGVAFSSDGQRAASGGDDRTVRIWDVATGKEMSCLKGAAAEIHAIAFSNEGNLLLSAGCDRLLRLWNIPTGQQLRAFHGHTDTVRCVAFSPDGKQAVSGGDDRSLRSWDVAAGQEIASFAGHTGAVTSVAWSHDGRHVLSGSSDGTARLWDVVAAKQICSLEGHAGAVLTVAFAPGGKTALTGGNDKMIRLWELSSAKELHCFKGHANAVIQVQVAAKGDVFLSSSSQHKITELAWRRWDLVRRNEIGSMAPGEDVRFGCAVFSPDCRHVFVGGPGGFLRLFTTHP